MTSSDSTFDGISHPTLPPADFDFSCKNNAPTRPDVVVDIKQDVQGRRSFLGEQFNITIGEPQSQQERFLDSILNDVEGSFDERWVRLPVTEVEEVVNKDGPADITRTATVKFPLEWGDESMAKFINGFRSQNTLSEQEDPYDEARIFYWDEQAQQWIITHYGYVGGVGPANEPGIGKFFVYDPADLMRGIQVSKAWANPSVDNVVDFVLRGTDATGDEVGLEKRSVFERIPLSLIGQTDIPKEKIKDVRERDPEDFTFAVDIPFIGTFRQTIDGIAGSVLDFLVDQVEDLAFNDQKRFQVNRHNMVDLMEWVTNLIDARWWFEPSPGGPILTIDASAYKSGPGRNSYERRRFVDENVLQDLEDPTFFATVDTLNNSALVDIKPFNSVTLYGESTTYRERYSNTGENQISADIEASTDTESAKQNFKQSASAGGYTEEYPFVEVSYPPLVERAGGYKYGGKPIESDKLFLSEARNQAIKELRNNLAEATEGSIVLKGEPHINPYDYIATVPACNDTYPNINSNPIEWEVNEVTHIRRAGESYRTELGVSIAVNDSEIEAVAEYREA